MSYSYGEPLNSSNELQGRDSVDLLARMIYAETYDESYEGKQGVAHVAKNRKAKNLAEFGGSTYEGVLLYPGAFAMTGDMALKPNTSSQQWQDSLEIASNMSSTHNPISSCLWFNRSDYYNTRIKKSENNTDLYKFPGSSTYQNVALKVTLGNHTFFRVDGY